MALSPEDRVSISLKIVQIPVQNANADKVQAQLEGAKVDAQKEDDSNRVLMDNITPLVDAYQTEIQRYDSQGRTFLVEQDLLNSVDRKLSNSFFPNNTERKIPSVPDGAWKSFPSFSGLKGIGKDYIDLGGGVWTEGYSVVQKEQDLIDAINVEIATIEALVDASRSSGDECIGSCAGETPPGSGIDEATCLINGGVWSESKQPSVTMQTAATTMKAAVQAWEDFMNTTFAAIPTNIQDPEPTRSAQNDASRLDISNSIVVINAWQAIQDFDTITATPASCPAFDIFASSNFDPSKFRADELAPLKNEIIARQSFINTRTGELNINLGGVVQDLDNGEIISATGFYGNRFRIIDMRLNAIGGSLGKVKGIERGQDAQEESKKSNDNASAVYSSIMIASIFTAPSGGNKNIHVKDASGFSVSDLVYVTAVNQSEIQATIVEIDGDRVVLSVTIPKKYRETDLARLYKEL